MKEFYRKAYLEAQAEVATLLERYYINFIYGSYNKKRIIFNDFKGSGELNYLFFGDSHLITFEHIFMNNKNLFSKIHSRRFHGMTLYSANAMRYNSRYRLLEESLKQYQPQRVIINLGEVDCRNAFALLCKKKQMSTNAYLKIVEQNISSNILYFQKQYLADIYICTIPPPCYTDRSLWTKKSCDVKVIKNYNKLLNNVICETVEKHDGAKIVPLHQFAEIDDYMIMGDHHISEKPVTNTLKHIGML